MSKSCSNSTLTGIVDEYCQVSMSKKEAALFYFMRKYQHIWETLELLRPGSLVIHMDIKGQIRKYETHFYQK